MYEATASPWPKRSAFDGSRGGGGGGGCALCSPPPLDLPLHFILQNFYTRVVYVPLCNSGMNMEQLCSSLTWYNHCL